MTKEIRELGGSELRFAVDLDGRFTTTQELTVARDFVGQERAVAALELGLGMRGPGFHLFIHGLTGANKLQTLRDWVAQRVSAAPTPGDWVYVHNFKHPDLPRAIVLQAGQGMWFKDKMHKLIETLKEDLPQAFRAEAFEKEKSLLRDKYGSQARELESQLDRLAKEKGFRLQPGPGGNVLFIPVVDSKPLENQEEFARLSQAEQDAIGKRQQELASEMTRLMQAQRSLQRDMEADVRSVERRFGEQLLGPLLADIEREVANEKVRAYLAEVREHILDNLEDFKEQTTPDTAPFPLPPQASDAFVDYEVNVVVDNGETSGAPVLIESVPTHMNLFGTIERVVDRGGRLVTNFTRIKAGALLKAHEGYLIFNLEDAITEPAVWKTLKRTMKSGRIEMETYEPFALFATAGIKPEPIDIDTKVIVVGNQMLYHLLYTADPEFREIFKIEADFRHTMEREPTHMLAYAHWVATLCQDEGLPHFERGGVERLVEFGSRQAGDREKISASQPEVADLIREAAYWCRADKSQFVAARHVKQALQKRIFRANRIEEELRDMIAQGTLLIDIEGRKIGQVNGLSILDLGGYAFGRPARVTASVGMGQAGIINVERESRLSGSIHDKGILILAGYLRNRYGQDKPLSLSASLCFEQSYTGIEGDSASSAELYALLSQLSDIPIRQDIAVTGSVNQWGEVQAIGGVNEKVEGFFDICRIQGLTGDQGTMIPAANVRNLILRTDVVQAVEQGKFHIYPIQTIDEGITILTGTEAGEIYEEGTLNAAVDCRLRQMALALKTFVGKDQRFRLPSQNGEEFL